MNKVIFIALALLALAFMINCSDSGSDGSTDAFIDPSGGAGFVTKTVTNTNFTITGTAAESCPNVGSDHCAATVFSQNIGDTGYSGFAVKDSHIGGDNNFFLKAYWSGALADGSPTMTLIVYRAGNYHTETKSCSIDVTDNGDSTYTIQFITANCVVGAFTINNGSTIRGYYH